MSSKLKLLIPSFLALLGAAWAVFSPDIVAHNPGLTAIVAAITVFVANFTHSPAGPAKP